MQSRAASELGITKLLPQKLSEMFLPVSLEIDLLLRIADKTNQRGTRCSSLVLSIFLLHAPDWRLNTRRCLPNAALSLFLHLAARAAPGFQRCFDFLRLRWRHRGIGKKCRSAGDPSSS